MEELRTSRRPAAKKSSYGDVFGGAPKYSASSDEYAEIFGGIATSSCSIPFLDLPPVSDGSDGGFVDYSEIFGGFHGGGDFAVDYEELFGTQRKKEVGGSPSSNGRTSIEVKFRQQDGEVQHLPQVGAAQDYEVYPLKNTLSSSSNHFDDVSKQFNMSFHRTNLGSMDDAMSGKMHTTQLHAIPGYSYVVDTFSSIQDVRTDNFPNIETNCPIQTASNGQANHFDDTKSNEAALKTNQKEPNSQFTTTENAPLNMKHHSRSSSNYSSSSGDISNPDITYVGVSDISLRTQPCKVPPPSRAPPKLVSKQENSKTRVYEEGNFLKPKLDHQIRYRVGDAKSHRLQGVAKDTSAAAAAMKEAMEQAQARLKTAKELMERKRDNLQSRKKLSQKEGTKYGERKEVKAFEEDKIFDNEIFEKPLIKEDISKKGYALDDRNGDRSSQLPDKSEEVSGEWKMDTQFYELVNNDSKFKVIKEASKQEDVERKIKESCVIEDNKSYPEQAEKLHMDKEIFESDDDNIKADNMTCKEEITEMLNTNHGNVNKFEEAYSSHLENRTEKLQSDHEAQNPIFVEEALVYREGEKDEESSNNAFKDDKISHDDEEACQFDYREKLSRPSVTSVSYEIEKKPEILLRKDVQDETQIEVNFTSTKCELEEEEEVVAVECQLEEDECELEETALASKHEESGNLDGAQGDCMEGKDELKSKVALDAYVVKENTEELKPPLATIEKEIKSANENPDCNEIETSEAQPEVQKNNMNQNADEKTSTELESTIKPRDLQGDNIESEDDGLKQGDKVENSIPDTQNTEEMENEIKRDRKHEKEQARKAEEEREREREREKDRLAVERATRQAHERALNEARERAERIAVERVTAEARQRALAEAREKAERASAAALEKALAEKALKEAKIRAERAAVERATAEARERAVEKALAEKAAADARQRAERFSAISRDKGRKENEVKAGDKDDREVKLNVSSSDVLRDVRFQNGGDVDSPLRCKARLERHQRTVERAAKALAEKNMRDILAQREQAERNRLAESLDADVRRWATGKEGNLRALLSTLQYILGPENGWQPIPLTDVITAAAAKKAYRKATLCVHPDKLQQRGATIQQKYICEKVFDLLKDAWNRFNSEER